jgi:hypothetical protein
VVARAAPSRSAAPVTRLWLLTPEKTTNLVQAIEGRRTEKGVGCGALPILPTTRPAAPRRTLGNWRTVRTHLLVDRGRLTLTLYRAGKPVFWRGWGRPAAVTHARRPVLRAEHALRPDARCTARSRSARARARPC